MTNSLNTHDPHTNMVPSSTQWENSPPHRPMIRNLHRRELVDRVRILLLRQKRAYNHRLKLLQRQSREGQAHNPELLENNQQFRLTMDLPGVHPSDIQVQIDTSSRILTISAKRLFMALDDVTCRRTQLLRQQYRICSNVILQFKATLQNGVLAITAPKLSSSSKEANQEIGINISGIPSSSEGMKSEPVMVVPISYL